MSLLKECSDVQDLKMLTNEQLDRLCTEVRWVLIARCAVAGGHLATNLAMVELTLGMYASWVDPAQDLVIFDGQHAGYVHKMFTGRKAWFTDVRCMHSLLTSQTTTLESPLDVLNFGHGGFGAAAALGLAMATGRRPVLVMGDGVLSNGVAMQALNVLGSSDAAPVVVVNDNKWFIGAPVGGLHEQGSISGLLAAMGYAVREVDGHDVAAVRAAVDAVHDARVPVAIHAHTEKGHGFTPAAQNPVNYHYILSGGDVAATNPLRHLMGAVRDEATEHAPMDAVLAKLMNADASIVAITAAMMDVGLGDQVRATGRLLDVGIAEEQAVCTAVGLAMGGQRPVIACCATYLQRMLDAFLNVALVNGPLNIVAVVHEAGVNNDGPFQQGVHAFTCVNLVPGARQLLPRTRAELHTMLAEVLRGDPGLVFIQVPHEFAADDLPAGGQDWAVTRSGHDVVIVPFGNAWALGAQVAEKLGATLVHAPVVDDDCWTGALASVAGHQLVVTVEEGFIEGGLGQRLAARLPVDQRALCLGVEHLELTHFERSAQLPLCGLTVEAVVARIRSEQSGGV